MIAKRIEIISEGQTNFTNIKLKKIIEELTTGNEVNGIITNITIILNVPIQGTSSNNIYRNLQGFLTEEIQDRSFEAFDVLKLVQDQEDFVCVAEVRPDGVKEHMGVYELNRVNVGIRIVSLR